MSHRHPKAMVGLLTASLFLAACAGSAPVDQNATVDTATTKAPAASPITLGFIGPQTGDVATLGLGAKTAVEVAVEEINKAGGINGRELKVIYEDGKCQGKDAASAASKLINVDKVPVIIGALCSSETSSFAPLAEESKTVVISYCSSAPAISKAGDYIFRTYPSDLYQGAFAADYVYKNLNKKKVAVLYMNSDWGTGIKDVFVPAFKKLGGEILAEEGFEQTSQDLRTQLTKIKSLNPELIYFLGYTDASIAGLKQAQELKLNVPIFGGDAWDDPKIFTEVGSAGEGIMYSVVGTSSVTDEYKQKIKAKTQSDQVTICNPQAYDAVKILANIMSKVGTDPTAIKDELYKTSYLGGVSSPKIEFDANGDLKEANYVVKIVKNGKAEELK